METLTMATTNPAKVDQLAGVLRPLGIEVIGIDKDITKPLIDEDGKTAIENARKKAVTYAKYYDTVVFSMDNALYINGLPDAEQPGLHVRRIGHLDDAVTDEQLLDYYTGLIASLGDEVKGHWEYGVCIATPDGRVYESTINSSRIFKRTPSAKMVEGYPLESIQIDPESRKYISEMTTEEQTEYWQRTIGGEVTDFVKSTGLFSV